MLRRFSRVKLPRQRVRFASVIGTRREGAVSRPTPPRLRLVAENVRRFFVGGHSMTMPRLSEFPQQRRVLSESGGEGDIRAYPKPARAKGGGEEGIRTLDTALDRITV